MIFADTDMLDELYKQVSRCASKGEDAWYFLRMTTGEMIDDAAFMALPAAEAAYQQITAAAQACGIMKDMLAGMQRVLAGMADGYRSMETEHENKIRQISEVTAAVYENFNAAFTVGDGYTEGIVRTKELTDKYRLEELLYDSSAELARENLAAVHKMLKEDYRFEEVGYEADE